MTNNPVALPKSLIIFAICIPIALLVGYLLATPTEYLSLGLVVLILLGLSIPLFLRWHHPMLIFAWNTNLTVFFLPGQPSLWMVAAALSLFLTILACVMERQIAFQNVRSITWPLLFLVGVILVTAKLTGGIGVRSFGAETYGGKKFFFVLGAIIGYFALSSRPIPIQKAQRYTGLFFLSGLTAAVSNLIYLAGPSFYFLFLFFSVDNALSQAMEDFSSVASSVHFGRVQGVTVAAMAGFYFMLSRYGIRGVLDLVKPWRWIFLLICLALSLLGGFRSAVVLLALICVGQFYFERLFRTRLLL